jgi:hypothetical protein
MPEFDPTIPVNATPADADPIRVNFAQLAIHHAGATEPSAKSLGYIWLDTSNGSNHLLKAYDGSAWNTLLEHVESAPTAVPAAHGPTHQASGADQISVAGLSGLLATPQTPAVHGPTHGAGAADPVSVEALATAGAVGTVLTSKGDGSAEMALPESVRVETSDPTATDDGDAGFPVGTQWLNTVTQVLWISVDDTTDAAVWRNQTNLSQFVFTFSNGGAVLNTGVQDAAYKDIPFDCEIVSARMFGGPSGSVEIDLWVDTYANYPPTVADTIVAAAPPSISGGVKSEDTSLTGWTKTLAAGSGILPNINSVTNMTWAKLVLLVEAR